MATEEMGTLSEALLMALGPTLGAAVRAAWTPSDDSRPPLWYLTLPPTEQLEAEVVEARRLFLAQPDTALQDLRDARRKMTRIEERLVHCHTRDELQALRPEGCWCLGWGRREMGGVPSLDTGIPEPVYDYCSCVAGAERRVEDAEALDELAEQRTLDREARRQEIATRLMLPSRFARLTLDSYPVSEATRHPWEMMTHWARDGLTNSALLIGPASTGKTGLAAAALREKALGEIRGGLYVTAPGLLRKIREGFNATVRRDDDGVYQDGGARDFFSRAESVYLLLLDDLGKEHATDWATSTMFELIQQRHAADRPTLVTSNLDLDELAARIEQPNLDRLLEMCGGLAWVFDFAEAPNLRVKVG